MKRSLLVSIALITTFIMMAQTHTPNRVPQWGKGGDRHGAQAKTMGEQRRGFWIAAEVDGAYCLRMDKPRPTQAELDVTAGYRFSSYFKVGAGLGLRWISESGNELRYRDHKWAMPLYLDARGVMINDAYRNVVPYWSMDIGTSITEGFMFRPSVGIRVGQPRSAFTLALSFTFQNMKGYDYELIGATGFKNRLEAFVGLRAGYEF